MCYYNRSVGIMFKEHVQNLKELLEPFFSKIVVGVIVLLMGFIIGKFTKRLVQKILSEIGVNENIRKVIKKRVRVEEFLSSLTGIFIYFITVVMVLEILGLSEVIVHILTIGVLVLMVALTILTMRDFIPNVLASQALNKKEHLEIGTPIEIDNIKGTIKEMNLNDIQIETSKGDIVHIPNSLFIKKTFRTVKKKEL